MDLSQTAQATLLLASYFSKPQVAAEKPLTNTEWGRFALWLKNKDNTPADLLLAQPRELLEGWHDSKVTIERLIALLGRGHSLALAVEKWQRSGLWVVTRSDVAYPRRLKSRLKIDAPPVLFGCGNKELLNTGGIAVVGSRNAGDEDLQFTHALGAKAASHCTCIISGGASGESLFLSKDFPCSQRRNPQKYRDKFKLLRKPQPSWSLDRHPTRGWLTCSPMTRRDFVKPAFSLRYAS